MSKNPHVKPLKGFDPKSALEVDESFVRLLKRGDDMLELSPEDASLLSGNSKSGKECGMLRTGGAIHSSFTKFELESGRTVFAACSIKGEVLLFEPDGDAMKEILKYSVQGSIYRDPVYIDGILYCVTREGVAYAAETGLDEEKSGAGSRPGEIIWQKKMEKGIFTSPVVKGKVVIITPADGIYAFDAFNGPDRKIGEILWGVSINGVLSTPVISSGMLFAGTEEKRLLAFDYAGNRMKKMWEYNLNGACRAMPHVSEVSGQVVAGTIEGAVFSLTRENGEFRWNFQVKAPVLSSVISVNTSAGEIFFFGADNGFFYALDSRGKKLWEFRTKGKIRTEALVNEGVVYFGCEDNTLYGLDIRNGKQVFRFQADGNIYTRPEVHDNRLYFCSTDGYIHSVYL